MLFVHFTLTVTTVSVYLMTSSLFTTTCRLVSVIQVVWTAERLGAGTYFNTAVWWRGHVSH